VLFVLHGYKISIDCKNQVFAKNGVQQRAG
jgi:hypothetical protein